MHALIVGAAPVPGEESYYRALLQAAEAVVAADAAAEWCVSLGRVPDSAVGDFDSAEHGAVSRLAESGVDVRAFPGEKDTSDLDLCVDAARAMGADRVTFTAAFSSRLDHTLSSIGSATRASDLLAEIDEPDVAGWILDAASRRELVLNGPPGALVSVFALGAAADWVNLTGMRYGLTDTRLASLSSLGLSNELTGEKAGVSVGSGRLLVLAPGSSGAELRLRATREARKRYNLPVMGGNQSSRIDDGAWIWLELLALATAAIQGVALATGSLWLGVVGLLALLAFAVLAMLTVRAARSETRAARQEQMIAIAAPPPAPTEPAPPPPERPAVRMPATTDPEVVALALLESAAAAGPAVAAHLWLEDPSSATLRLVASVGSMVPDPHPRPLDDDPLGTAIADGVAHLTAVAVVHAATGTATMWRFAFPVQAGAARGVGAIDFSDDVTPDSAILVDVTAQLRGALSGALALHVAQNEMATARMLLVTARELSRRLDPEEVISHTLERAMSISAAATGSIMLLDKDKKTLIIAASAGLPADIVQDTRLSEGEGIAGWVLATRKAVLVEDLPGKEQHFRRTDIRSAVSVPIQDEDGILGVLNVGSRSYPARFTNTHMSALEILGTQTAVALRNAWALTSARDLYFATLRALTVAMETKDPYAQGGTDRVVDHTMAIARAMALEEQELQALEVAALLHDIGMTASGESMPVSGRPLSTYERGLLKLHPVLAAEILDEVPALKSVIPIVYHHHEWFDGEGYVVGLSGESIPIGSRILSVADAYVAMTSDRPYRGAMTSNEAVAELEDKAGTQFDPDVVEVFVDLLRRDRELRREPSDR